MCKFLSMHFAYTNDVYHHISPVWLIPLFILFYVWGNWSSGMLKNLPKGTVIMHGRAEIQMQVVVQKSKFSLVTNICIAFHIYVYKWYQQINMK